MRSKLFVPGSRPELFAKAMAGPADGLSFDLEDAVDPSRKAEARGELGRYLASLPANSGKTVSVRVNGIDTAHFPADLEAIACPALDIVNLPKPESVEDVRACAAALTKIARARARADRHPRHHRIAARAALGRRARRREPAGRGAAGRLGRPDRAAQHR